MNNLIRVIAIGIFVLFSATSLAQNKAASTKNWKIVSFDDTVNVKIIKYYPATFHCGIFSTISLAICLDENGDSLRIIEKCPLITDYKEGQKLIFIPYKNLNGQDFSDEMFEKYGFNTVIRTAFGNLRNR